MLCPKLHLPSPLTLCRCPSPAVNVQCPSCIRYYSNPNGRYLEVILPQGPQQENLEGEFLILRVALRVAVATDRILILPAFHCHNCAAFPNGRDREACSGACSF